MFKRKKLSKYYCPYLLFLASLLILNCTIVYSPHAQNEMVTPYNQKGVRHEIGSAFAYNKWIKDEREGVIYVKTYPTASFSLFYNVYHSQGNFGGFGSIELVCLPLQWWVPDVSGFMLWLKPYAGFQYNGRGVTCRLNFLPCHLSVGYGEGEWYAGWETYSRGPLYYQLTILAHNYLPSDNIYWVGVRNSPSALGFLGGYEYSPNKLYFFRTEYSYLIRPPFSLFLTEKERESIVGSVHYLTLGIFKRIK